MKPLESLEQAYTQTERVVGDIRDGDLPKPTPCTEWDVSALLGHYYNVIKQFPAMLRGEEPDWGRQPALSDREREFREVIKENLDAWRAPGAADRPSDMVPGLRMIDFNLTDAIIHTWDLGRALGTDVEFAPEAIELVLAVWSDDKMATARQYGASGPEVVVPVTAPPLDRLLGRFGRRP